MRYRLEREVYMGRKTALDRTLAERALREGPFGLEMAHFDELDRGVAQCTA